MRKIKDFFGAVCCSTNLNFGRRLYATNPRYARAYLWVFRCYPPALEAVEYILGSMPLIGKYLLFINNYFLLFVKKLSMQKNRVSIIALIFGLLGILYFSFTNWLLTQSSTGPFPMDWSINIPTDDTSFGGLLYTPIISDSLPHYKYKLIDDSIKQKKEVRDRVNRCFGPGRSFGSIGVYAITQDVNFRAEMENRSNEPISKAMLDSITKMLSTPYLIMDSDSIKKKNEMLEDIMQRYRLRQDSLFKADVKQRENKQDYFFALNNYNLDYESKFYLRNGTSNLLYTKYDSVVKRKYDSTKVGHYESKQIPIRYNTEEKKILIPISKRLYKMLEWVITILIYVIQFLSTYIFLGLPFQILFNISRGRAFQISNIKMFKTMAFVLFAYTVWQMISPYLLHFLFRHKIPSDFTLDDFKYALLSNLNMLLLSVGLFVIAKAFKQGYKLQQEQDLTV